MQRYYRLALVILVLTIFAILAVWLKPLNYGLDLAGGTRVVLQAKPEAWAQVKPAERDSKMKAVIETIRRRVGGFQGVTEPVVQRQGEQRVVVELPGITDPEKAIEALRSTAELEFFWLKDVKSDRNRYAKWQIPSQLDKDESGNDVYYFIGPNGEEVRDPEEIMEKVVNRKENPPVLTGADLKPNAGANISGNRPVIHIEFNPHGAEVFRDFTRRHVGDILAIFFDGKLLTAPRINEAIPSGRAEISGFSDLAEANQKAQFLNSGALPIPLDIEGRDSVEASLGRETVKQAVVAGLVGLVLVLLFMLIYYKLPGAVANIALILYALFTIAVFKMIGVTMTLPGFAGLILSIGMAVDANILIFERLKEELRSGKTLRAAIETGFSRAFTAIFDSNMCTAITCAILMWFGSGQVQSFAFVLLLGVAISMFTAITVTRTILFLLVNWEWAQKPSLFGLSRSWFALSGRQVDIIGKRKWYFLFSGVIIAIGLFYLVTSGLKPGIEFSSGSAMQLVFQKPVTASAINATIKSQGLESMVQISGRKTAFIKMKEIKQDDPKLHAMYDALKEKHGNFEEKSFSFVGPTVSKELVGKASMSILVASILIILYLSGRFAIGGFLNGLKYGICAVFALVHDVLILVGGLAVMGALRGWEVDSLFITAILTTIGYSVHDTIVIFDRLRENLKHRRRGESFEEIANSSILQTFSRSINTSVTVMFPLIALIAFGGPLLQHFYVFLLVGVVFGTYSSIFEAAPLLVVWEGISNRGNVAARRAEERPMVDMTELQAGESLALPGKKSTTSSLDESQEAADASSSRGKVKSKKRGVASKKTPKSWSE